MNSENVMNDVEAILNDLYPKQQYEGSFITANNTIEGLRSKVVADEETQVIVSNKNLLTVTGSASEASSTTSIISATYNLVKDKTYLLSFDTEKTNRQCYIQKYTYGSGFKTIEEIKNSGTGTNYFTCDGNRHTFKITPSGTGTFKNINIIWTSTSSSAESGYITNVLLEAVDEDETESSDYVEHKEQNYNGTEINFKTYDEITHIYNIEDINMSAEIREKEE